MSGDHWSDVRPILAVCDIWERYYWVVIGAMSWLSAIFGSVIIGWPLGDGLAVRTIWEHSYWVVIGAMSWLSPIFGSVLIGW